MSCHFAHRDGAYVLGALTPAERQEFEDHLPGCPTCAVAVRELAGLPGLLSRVDPAVLTDPAEEPPVPDTLLPALLRAARRTGRRRVQVWSAVAAVAAVAATVGVLATTGQLGGATEEPSSPTESAAGQDMSPVDGAPVSGHLVLADVAWGTRIDLTCTYAPESGETGTWTTYALVVRTRDGGVQQVGTWQALPGRTMRVTGATAASTDDIASVEVQTTSGTRLLELDG